MSTDHALMFLLAAGVGVLSSWLGVGGGVLLVPIFTLLFHMPMIQALALSLCCIMATSLTSSTRYLAAGLVDVKAALGLEITTLIFSYIGGRVVGWVSVRALAFAFAAILIVSAIALVRSRRENPTGTRPPKHAYPIAVLASTLARSMVGLLGIGGGIVLVPVLQFTMRKGIKEAVATSTFMLGTSAAVALIPYIHRGDVPFVLVPFAALGTVTGAFIGSRLFHKIESLYIKMLFAALMLYTAFSMVMKGLNQ